MTATLPILCYHAVGDDGGPLAPWALTPERFDDHLGALAGAGYRPVALDDVLREVHDDGGPVPADALVLTVDDGYADVADTIAPRMAARGWPVTVFVTTGAVGGTFLDRPMLSRSHLVDLAASGVRLGAHGHRHLPLDTLSPEEAREEVHRSRGLLEDWTGRPVTTFAYPHGFHDRSVRQIVVDAGFSGACAVKQALSSTEDDRFALARVMPTGAVTGDQLVARLRSPRTPVARGGRERLRTTAHRVVRRLQARAA